MHFRLFFRSIAFFSVYLGRQAETYHTLRRDRPMKNKQKPEGMPIWFDGKSINEALFCEEFLSLIHI